MKQDLVKKRNKIYCEVWEKYKNRIAMEDLAEMFNVSLKSFYRIVKEGRQDNQLTNN